ncbi:uncharacterized protein LOC130273676 [Hyla sarda]|uniref:uncharacterized protein LOC130273676 n=1 Tax=Hyla sarda TaxID=327740 RepID=UPI0024C40330|nr:uncharacterized protein LOC130273676 [Hyla sarda]XP_056376841.1 uncharacterized protein LOC130273676 [Hyla sarda]XP_056376842.1 uncharacterized protein LOC130273676 [Hyla sarda]XP_056376844.1 uncharacterized protein LOC130273676 [Hyla sarda]XP_056376845.1 uncharacterized protein LOC130273676 [Hyla sarda]XP_056376846.1 uncharacterized protein LOC130273676 [Hyla sarda]XP_056376847.1 uncharacterized protein LOC130273676 [Hyla sarda]
MSAEQNKPLFVCEVCQVFCSSALHFSDHIGGIKHRNAVKEESPELLENIQRLQYFLDTFLTDEPMLGLEYIVEHCRNGTYSYKCLLCETQTPRGTTILHLCGSKHRIVYLKKHHPELVVNQLHFSKRSEYTQQLKLIASQVEKMHGRKRILQDATEINEGKAGPNPAKVPKMSSTLFPEELPPPKGVLHRISPANKSVIENIMVNTEKLNQLMDFTTNNDFLNYLRSFQIKNDGDASFVQQITKNCTKALLKFREEQTKTQVFSTVASNTDSKNDNSSDKAIPPMFQNTSDATDAFFNSIKNMNASEVIVILKKIAATNPAFRDINIPSLIKHLQETGRLKSS